ncbi:MAG: cation-transporting P-type ATPase [Elainellaceae cyanobacterium]
MVLSRPSTVESLPSHLGIQPSPVWSLPIEAVYPFLETGPDGLPASESQRRFEKFGANELPKPASRPLWLRFTDQLTH